MSSVDKCSVCHGNKFIPDVGGMRKDCTACTTNQNSDQLRADLQEALAAYEVVRADNAQLKLQVEFLTNELAKSSSKTKLIVKKTTKTKPKKVAK